VSKRIVNTNQRIYDPLNKEYYKPTGQEILIACNGNYVGLAQDFISINCDYLVIARAIFDERRLSIPFDKLWNMLPLDIINFRDGNKYNTCWFDPTGSQSPFMVTGLRIFNVMRVFRHRCKP
jgi:hypothetical protein